jgi:hypothetical protein
MGVGLAAFARPDDVITAATITDATMAFFLICSIFPNPDLTLRAGAIQVAAPADLLAMDLANRGRISGD